MRIVMTGNFGLRVKGTMAVRALPIACALVSHGHQVTMLLPPWDSPEDAEQEIWLSGVRVVQMSLAGSAGAARYPVLGLRLLRLALAAKPDVIHAFKPISYSGVVALGLWMLKKAGLSRTRLVVDADDWEGVGGWADALGLPAWQRTLVSWQERWCLTHCDALTVASRELERVALELGVPEEKIRYVPNGYMPWNSQLTPQLGLPMREKYGLGEAPIVLLYSRFFEFDTAWLAAVIERVQRLVPQIRLLMVGEGFSGEEELLLEALKGRGLGDIAAFAGWVEAAQLPSYFAAADVAIYPLDDTLINRTKCPVKLVELLAAGLPVVASAVGQAKEYISHGENGLLVTPGDTDAFASAVAKLLGDARLRVDLGQAASAKMARDYRWDRLVDRVEAAYGISD